MHNTQPQRIKAIFSVSCRDDFKPASVARLLSYEKDLSAVVTAKLLRPRVLFVWLALFSDAHLLMFMLSVVLFDLLARSRTLAEYGYATVGLSRLQCNATNCMCVVRVAVTEISETQ